MSSFIITLFAGTTDGELLGKYWPEIICWNFTLILAPRQLITFSFTTISAVRQVVASGVEHVATKKPLAVYLAVVIAVTNRSNLVCVRFLGALFVY